MCISIAAYLGESCINPSKTCVDDNAICGSEDVCVCETGYVRYGSKCFSSNGQFKCFFCCFFSFKSFGFLQLLFSFGLTLKLTLKYQEINIIF